VKYVGTREGEEEEEEEEERGRRSGYHGADGLLYTEL
jgi:hypothetical protein